MSNNITEIPFFYDSQFRKYIQQFIRLFSGFQVMMSHDESGNAVHRVVPVRYGDLTRQAAHIMKQNTENYLSTTPFISCYVSGLQIAPELRTYPQYEETVPVIEKKYDKELSTYLNEQGNVYSITRHQPVPYKLSMTTDIWTSNTEQKLQLLEQILTLFNPSLNIHTNNNPMDWSTLSVVELVNTTWTNRMIPQGVDDIIDISSLNFEMPILINPPAKVQKNSMIHTILTNLHVVATGDAADIDVVSDINALESSYVIVTLGNYKLRFTVDELGNATAKILSKHGTSVDENGQPLNWNTIFKSYGKLRDGISQIRLKQTTDPSDTTQDIVGTLSTNLDDTLLTVTLDENTIPANTLTPIDKIINPQSNYPGDGVLPAASLGQRYLLADNIADGGVWGGVSASKNDIIEYTGSEWIVSFNSLTANAQEDIQYTTNLTTLDKLKWTEDQWINAFEGTYNAGFWRIYL